MKMRFMKARNQKTAEGKREVSSYSIGLWAPPSAVAQGYLCPQISFSWLPQTSQAHGPWTYCPVPHFEQEG